MHKKKPVKIWVATSPSKAACSVPETTKLEVREAFEEVLQQFRNHSIKDVPPNPKWNYIIEISSKWYRHYFYLYAIYKCFGPNAIKDTFESKFARLEYTRPGRYNLAYMRHTEQWWEVEQNLSVSQCKEMILSDEIFHP